MRFFLAFRVFFKLIFNRSFAESVQALQSEPDRITAPVKEEKRKAPSKPVPTQGRSEAITLLAALQREARLLDLIMEPLADYSDEQVGAAARDVLRDSATVINRFFAITALSDAEEGSRVEAPENFDPQKYRLTGQVSDAESRSGQLTHHGWEAQKCEIPKWSGKQDSRNIIAPIEIQV